MIAVIVINYKSCTRTIDFVQNEVSKIKIPHKVVIVNNGATTETDKLLSDSLNAPIVHVNDKCDCQSECFVISNPENSGFAKGNNIGASFSINQLKAEYLLFSNNDIQILDNGLVETLTDKLERIPTAGIVGPRIVGLDGKLQSPEPFMSFWDRHIWMYLCTPFYSKQKKAKRFHFDYSEKAQEGFHYKLMGSFFMVRAKDFIHCGMMDENTFLYCEEPILSERMKRIGLQAYYCPSVSVLHDHGATIKSNFRVSKRNNLQFESECYYYKEYINTSLPLIYFGRLVHIIKNLL